MPSYSILKAVGKTNINFVSLCIDRAEFDVMESIFKTINFGVSVGAIYIVHMDCEQINRKFLEFEYMVRRQVYDSDPRVEGDMICTKKEYIRINFIGVCNVYLC